MLGGVATPRVRTSQDSESLLLGSQNPDPETPKLGSGGRLFLTREDTTQRHWILLFRLGDPGRAVVLSPQCQTEEKQSRPATNLPRFPITNPGRFFPIMPAPIFISGPRHGLGLTRPFLDSVGGAGAARSLPLFLRPTDTLRRERADAKGRPSAKAIGSGE